MSIKFGATYPTQDLGTDPAVLRDWANGLESIDYDELFIPEHVVGINADQRPDWKPLNPTTMKKGRPIYEHTNPFFEPFVVMGFLAAATSRIMLTSGVLVAPQRPTALIAKQAAIADVLSGGRIRLGVGVGWNDAEYAVLGADYKTRGRRFDEQIEVLRRLWTEESVFFTGEFDHLKAVGLCPMPVQRPIPLIIGGDSVPALERAATHGDGWFLTQSAQNSMDRCARFWERVDELGRRDQMTLIGTVQQGNRSGEELVSDIAAWRDQGATHLNIRTAAVPVPGSSERPKRKTDVNEHLSALEATREAFLAGSKD
ncbi:putative F420-dependent oxidoreductase [Rhodococcus sp. 27YEA15]|uniref:LLM class F420-dependent oxidoreductase n=1 Tax=Rhodococcus sp. 27YEA15 TaxID=3156259 RepID=UPI003C7D6303